MRNNRRFNVKNENKKVIYISVAVIIIAISAFITTFNVYNSFSSKKKIADLNKITELASNEESKQTTKYIGKAVNELEEEQEEISKIAINTNNIEAKIEQNNISKTNENSNNEIEDEIINTSIEPKEEVNEKIPDPTFIKPIEGDIIKDFSIESLVYSQTLKEWITHTGIDIKAEKKSIVKASADGKIKAIKNDPRYGITVIIEHNNNYESIYSNLLTAEFVKEGEEIKQGETIGTVGDTASFEVIDEPHLHFEILKDGEYLNPNDYI